MMKEKFIRISFLLGILFLLFLQGCRIGPQNSNEVDTTTSISLNSLNDLLPHRIAQLDIEEYNITNNTVLMANYTVIFEYQDNKIKKVYSPENLWEYVAYYDLDPETNKISDMILLHNYNRSIDWACFYNFTYDENLNKIKILNEKVEEFKTTGIDISYYSYKYYYNPYGDVETILRETNNITTPYEFNYTYDKDTGLIKEFIRPPYWTYNYVYQNGTVKQCIVIYNNTSTNETYKIVVNYKIEDKPCWKWYLLPIGDDLLGGLVLYPYLLPLEERD